MAMLLFLLFLSRIVLSQSSILACDGETNLNRVLQKASNPSSVTVLNCDNARPRLTGTVPTRICDFTRLEQLLFRGNRLTGTLPNCMTSLTRLKTINFNLNNLEGRIPQFLGEFRELEKLELDKNEFNGAAPDMSQWSPSLTGLSIQGNSNFQITGDMPNLVHMTNLNSLVLSNQGFVGSIPASYGQLRHLNALVVDRNRLTGKIPSELFTGDIIELRRVVLRENSLTGTFPTEVQEMTSLREIVVSFNNLQGTLPSLGSEMAFLTKLNVMTTQMSGTVPESLLDLPLLESLAVSEARFAGPLPAFPDTVLEVDPRPFNFVNFGEACGTRSTLECTSSICLGLCCTRDVPTDCGACGSDGSCIGGGPTDQPSLFPTISPTKFPTSRPTDVPTKFPTSRPTDVPTNFPTKEPTTQTPQPAEPTPPPSIDATPPTMQPTQSPTPMATTSNVAPTPSNGVVVLELNPTNDMQVTFRVDPIARDALHIECVVSKRTWVAIGFSSQSAVNSMLGSAVIALPEMQGKQVEQQSTTTNECVSGSPCVLEHSITSRTVEGITPFADTSNLRDVVLTQEGSTTRLSFTTSRIGDIDVDLEGSNVVSFAHGTNNGAFEQHRVQDRAFEIVNWAAIMPETPTASPTTVAPTLLNPSAAPTSSPTSSPTVNCMTADLGSEPGSFLCGDSLPIQGTKQYTDAEVVESSPRQINLLFVNSVDGSPAQMMVRISAPVADAQLEQGKTYSAGKIATGEVGGFDITNVWDVTRGCSSNEVSGSFTVHVVDYPSKQLNALFVSYDLTCLGQGRVLYSTDDYVPRLEGSGKNEANYIPIIITICVVLLAAIVFALLKFYLDEPYTDFISLVMTLTDFAWDIIFAFSLLDQGKKNLAFASFLTLPVTMVVNFGIISWFVDNKLKKKHLAPKEIEENRQFRTYARSGPYIFFRLLSLLSVDLFRIAGNKLHKIDAFMCPISDREREFLIAAAFANFFVEDIPQLILVFIAQRDEGWTSASISLAMSTFGSMFFSLTLRTSAIQNHCRDKGDTSGPEDTRTGGTDARRVAEVRDTSPQSTPVEVPFTSVVVMDNRSSNSVATTGDGESSGVPEAVVVDT